MRRRALTLVEVLGVVVILGMVSGMFITSLAATDDAARLQEAAAACRDLDRMARNAAQIVGPVVVDVDDEERLVRLRRVDSSDVLSEVALPEGLRVTFDDVEEIAFDARGRSPDYTMQLAAENTRLAWRVAGLTGFIEEVRE